MFQRSLFLPLRSLLRVPLFIASKHQQYQSADQPPHVHDLYFHMACHFPRGGSTEGEINPLAAVTTTTTSESNVIELPATTTTTPQPTTTTTTTGNVDFILQEATILRHKGKELHDRGNWWEAAQVFQQAGDLLQQQQQQQSSDEETLNYRTTSTDYCTCRLHEALCRLKLEQYEACADICTGILVDPDQMSNTGTAIRSRAHHRRAKAYLHLGRDDEALEDARAAAFLGDRKAVALYGKLMRGNNSINNNNSHLVKNSNYNNNHHHNGGAPMDDLASPPMLNDLLQGRNPFLTNSNDASTQGGTSMLLESLLNKSSPSSGLADAPSLLGQGGAGGSLAKSLLSSLTKRLETDSDFICAHLHKTNPTQLQQLTVLAGIPLSEQQAQRLVKFCHSVTPAAIRRAVKLGKGAWYGFVVMRKVYRVFHKYKHLLILWALAAWIQSAIRRPIPISKRAAKALAASAAL